MGLALRILADPGAAEEVVQETFWRVWQRASAYRPERGVFAGWLLRITRNLAIDILRREKIRPPVAESDPAGGAWELQPDPAADVPEAVAALHDAGMIRAALAALPSEQRKVLELAYFRGLTRQEIAAAIAAPLGTVHTRARLGLEKLRQALAEEIV